MDLLNKEQKLIGKIKNILGPSSSYIGDDCAILPGKMLVTTDMLIETVHFSLDWANVNDLGWKAMAVNLSDIAAMAGNPKYALVAISMPEAFYAEDKIIGLYEGINACAKKYDTLIVGGDITRGEKLSIAITVIGEEHKAGVLMRSGAEVGDVIVVTGDFGASGAGLKLLQENKPVSHQALGQLIAESNSALPYAHCLKDFLHPMPKIHEAWSLIEQTGNRGALMDTSDGLADALLQIAQASNVGMRIDLSKIPIHEQTKQFAHKINVNLLDLALYGGEDYQLVACLPEKQWLGWQKSELIKANCFKQIGNVIAGEGIQLMFGNEERQKLDPKLIFQHIS